MSGRIFSPYLPEMRNQVRKPLINTKHEYNSHIAKNAHKCDKDQMYYQYSNHTVLRNVHSSQQESLRRE